MSLAPEANVPVLFPYFGGKSKVAPIVWERFGNVSNYIEPFAGSLAVLLRRPADHRWWERIETVNDADGLIVNFWRALQADPDGLADLASYPVTEIDLTSRHLNLVRSRETLTAQMTEDHRYYDLELAAHWVWGISANVGGDWCTGIGGFRGAAEDGPGVYRKMPMISGGHQGKGVHRLRPAAGPNALSITDAIAQDCRAIADRLRRVRVVAGDWSRVTRQAAAPADNHATGIFLDPPYDLGERRGDLYGVEEPVHGEVRDWALSVGDNPQMRIIYCGYVGTDDDEMFMSAGWQPVRWKTSGGYALQVVDNRSSDNMAREVLWCSPHTVNTTDMLPFD